MLMDLVIILVLVNSINEVEVGAPAQCRLKQIEQYFQRRDDAENQIPLHNHVLIAQNSNL